MLGVCMIGLPAHPIVSQRWSLVRMKRMLGRTGLSAAGAATSGAKSMPAKTIK